MNHGNVAVGVVYLVLAFIPIIGSFTLLGLSIYYGMKGNEIAVKSKRHFIDDAQFVAVQNAWRNWGFWCAGFGFLLGIGLGIAEVSLQPYKAST